MASAVPYTSDAFRRVPAKAATELFQTTLDAFEAIHLDIDATRALLDVIDDEVGFDAITPRSQLLIVALRGLLIGVDKKMHAAVGDLIHAR